MSSHYSGSTLCARWLPLLAVAVAATAGNGCRAEKVKEEATPSATAGTNSPGVSIGPTDFSTLRWLEGSWRGTLPTGGYFYERYHFADDSTIATQSFEDSTFASASDSAQIVLRGGKVYDRSAKAEWVATRLDSTGIDFTSTHGASNDFTWLRLSPDSWRATLSSTDAQGKQRTTVYPMKRVGR